MTSAASDGQGQEIDAPTEITSSLKNLRLDPPPRRTTRSSRPFDFHLKRRKPRRLLSLCLGVIGQYLEDVVDDLIETGGVFPPDIKLAMVAIARRRKLLSDDLLIALADKSWKFLDISGSDVTDSGLEKAAQVCTCIRAVDMSRCENITASGVSELIRHCRQLEILRCGGCRRSDFTARRCLDMLKPELNNVEEDSWEDLDSKDIGKGAGSLRWLVWPKVDEDSKLILATECPRVIVNPQPSLIGFHGIQVPVEALENVPLDHSVVEDIDPKTWAVAVGAAGAVAVGAARRAAVTTVPDVTCEIPIAERFRLAFVERDARLAPKRAKNERQHQRRAERDWLMNSTSAKSIHLASQASKSLRRLG